MPLTFAAGAVGGIAKLEAVLDANDPMAPLASENQVIVDVGFPAFVDLAPMLSRPNEIDSAADEHGDSVFWVRPDVVQAVLDYSRNWTAATISPTHPAGTYLSFNDMNLVKGGLFDTVGTWNRTPNGHDSHRLGTSVDANAEVYDVLTNALSTEFSASAQQQTLLTAACTAARGTLSALSGGNHCDFR